MQQITKTSDALTKKVIVNRISDVPGGVSLTVADLAAGAVVLEGTPLSAPSSGKRTICKQAKILATSTTTAIKVEAGIHNFKVGDFIGTAPGGKAYSITEITTASGVDTLTVGTAIDTPVTGAFIYAMTAEAANVDATLALEIAPGTSTGITEDLVAVTLKATMPNQSCYNTVVGTTTEPGNATVTVKSDLLTAPEVVTVAIADNDTALQAASKMRNALHKNANVNLLFDVTGEDVDIIITHKATSVNGATLKNAADVILKTAFTVPSTTQVIYMADAYVRADVIEGCIGSAYLATLDVREVKY